MESEHDDLKANIADIRYKMAKSAERAGNRPEDITIVAVTKTVGTDRIIQAVEAGLRDLGENRVQDLCEKYDAVKIGCNWHLIGHLQTNKVKYIIDKVSLIHSVDSLNLAKEIQKRAEMTGMIMDMLVQVNVAQEETKFGIDPGGVHDFIREIAENKNLRVKGLMTIAPFAQNPEDIRYVFRQLRKIFIDIRGESYDNIDMAILSMGMSNDYEIAIEEGSNMVRLGTAIFGKKQQ